MSTTIERRKLMAQKVQILLIDDLDGGDADETVEFGLDGSAYEIDLSAKNAGKLRDALAEYVAQARRVSRKRTTQRAKPSGRGASAAHIRQWARENGYEVSERGRVSTEVREAYAAAH